MRADSLDDAIDLANGTPFGLTSGIQSLDDREVERWIDRIEAGNLYVNRPITGAIVGRQPFGGWKGSSVGPGAKAGGPNYVLQLARWEQAVLPRVGAPPLMSHAEQSDPQGGMSRGQRPPRNEGEGPSGADDEPRVAGPSGPADDTPPSEVGGADLVSGGRAREPGGERPPQVGLTTPGGAGNAPPVAALLADCLECVDGDAPAADILRASATSYAAAWREHFARAHDPSALRGEQNVFRYRPCRAIGVRADPSRPGQRTALLQVILAALTVNVPLVVSLAGSELWPWLSAHPRVTVTVETEAELSDRLRARSVERLRALGTIGIGIRTAANESGVTVLDAPVVATGRLELRWYLREQTVTRVRHRYGNVVEPAGTE
jgi:RHH-type proline utilization regulon transcriptional repressor/proline dehydrogenase/delta 1-pyrroline-5-carboxylate dehydrogenase